MYSVCVSWWIVLYCGNVINIAHFLDDGQFVPYKTDIHLCRQEGDRFSFPHPSERVVTEGNMDCDGWRKAVSSKKPIEEVCSCPQPYNG